VDVEAVKDYYFSFRILLGKELRDGFLCYIPSPTTEGDPLRQQLLEAEFIGYHINFGQFIPEGSGRGKV